MAIKLEGRVAGPWAEELDRAWTQASAGAATKELRIDLSDVTYADAIGKRVLGRIYAQTGAQLLTKGPWTQALAEEVIAGATDSPG
jgi:anti-anti-sigma regulatory factor